MNSVLSGSTGTAKIFIVFFTLVCLLFCFIGVEAAEEQEGDITILCGNDVVVVARSDTHYGTLYRSQLTSNQEKFDKAVKKVCATRGDVKDSELDKAVGLARDVTMPAPTINLMTY